MPAAAIFVLLVTARISGLASPATSFLPKEAIAPDFNATDITPSSANGSDVRVAITEEKEVASSNESLVGVASQSSTVSVKAALEGSSKAPAVDQSLPMQFVFWPDDNDPANACRILDFSCWNVEKGLSRCGAENVVCSCHPRCLVFRNCCPDFPRVCPEPYERAVELYRQSPNVNTTCLAYSNVMVMSSCSPHFSSDEALVRACARPMKHNDSDRIPSADRRTGLHFLNKACAVCNGADQDDIEPFSSIFEVSRDFVRVSDVNNPHDVAVLLKDILRMADTSREIIVRYTHENEVMCPSHLISNCPEDNQDKELTLRCSSYTMYVKGKEMLYKNPHCVQCHQESECFSGRALISRSGGFPRSFSLIMDRAKAGADMNKVQLLSTRYTMKWAKTECAMQNNSVQNCHQTQCNSNFEMLNGLCEPKPSVWSTVLLVSWNEESADHSSEVDNDPESSQNPNEEENVNDEDDVTNIQDEAGDDDGIKSKSQDQSEGDDATTPVTNSGQNRPDLTNPGSMSRNRLRWGRSVPGFRAMQKMTPTLRSAVAGGGQASRTLSPRMRGRQQAGRNEDKTIMKLSDSDGDLLSTTDPSQLRETGPAWVQEVLSLLKTHFASMATSPEMNATWESPGPGMWRYRLAITFWAHGEDLNKTFFSSTKEPLTRLLAPLGDVTLCLTTVPIDSYVKCEEHRSELFHIRRGSNAPLQVTPSSGTGRSTGAVAGVVALVISVAILFSLG